MNDYRNIIGLIDLTSLNDSDTTEDITDLLNKSKTAYGDVAAICIYSHLVPFAVKKRKEYNYTTRIATVANFPHGSFDLERTVFETQLAVERGADEIDVVFPYHAFLAGDLGIGAKMISQVREASAGKTLKVIIESGELRSKKFIVEASATAIHNGANFIKTSTGKVKTNATLESAEIILNTIKQLNVQCGFKASGGIRDVKTAVQYLSLANKIMGDDWVTASTFRFGASGLLQDVLSNLNPEQN